MNRHKTYSGWLRTSANVIAAVCIGMCASASAQTPRINSGGIVNAAANRTGSIARGSVFAVFGQNLGPATVVEADSYPLPTTAGLGGTSVRVRSGTSETYCILLNVSSTQVTAVLPSNAPLGPATVSVATNSGSVTTPITVVDSAFGIFSVRQNGEGQAVAQNIDPSTSEMVQNARQAAAQPGQAVVLKGTGLGPVNGDEASGPLPGDLPDLDVTVFVGSLRAPIRYRGRSDCCVGVDQIVFDIPEGAPLGCNVPLAVTVGGRVSNFTTIAVASGTQQCQEALAHEDFLNTATDDVTIGQVLLLTQFPRLAGRLGGGSTIITWPYQWEVGSAVFQRFSPSALQLRSGVWGFPSVGTCLAFDGSNTATSSVAPSLGSRVINAGPEIVLSRSDGNTKTLRRSGGIYAALIGGTFEAVVPFVDLWLRPGKFGIKNGSGAPDGLGPFDVAVDLPSVATPRWTNRDAITVIERTQDLTIEIEASDNVHPIIVSGSATVGSTTRFFQCLDRSSASSVTVPAHVLQTMPAAGILAATISVGRVSLPVKFEAPGVDLGSLVWMVDSGKSVEYR